jgi:hypothetical protein
MAVNKNDKLVTEGVIPSLGAGEAIDVFAGLLLDSVNVPPQFLKLPRACQLLGVTPDGFFTIWNPDGEQALTDVPWAAEVSHSIESYPVNPISHQQRAASFAPPATWGGGGGGVQWCTLDDDHQAIVDARDEMLAAPATVILTDVAAGALQTAIDNAVDDDIIEVRTNAVYSPVTLPAGKSFSIRKGVGYFPVMSGTECVKIADGADGIIFDGFTFQNYTSPSTIIRGAGVSFAAAQSKCTNIHFSRCRFEEPDAGNAVLLNYHWATYTDPFQWDELSDYVSFLDCDFFRACKEGIEGGELALRGINHAFLYNTVLDGDKRDDGGNGSRGLSAISCPNFYGFNSVALNHLFNGGEGFKFDFIGPGPLAVPNSGEMHCCSAHSCIEGFDLDDGVIGLALDKCVAFNCTNEGFSLNPAPTEGTFTRCISYQNRDGFRLEAGSIPTMENNQAFLNENNNYRIDGAYVLPISNTETPPGVIPKNAPEGLIYAPMAAWFASYLETTSPSPWAVSDPKTQEEAIRRLAAAVDTLLGGGGGNIP